MVKHGLDPFSWTPDYLLHEIRRVAERPTVEELRARLERRPAVTSAAPPAEVVRAERDSR